MPEQSNDYRVAVFGAGGVGKSSLVLRFMKGTFREAYVPTVEDIYQLLISCDGSVCALQVIDTAGTHQFPAMQRLTISQGHAFILVYSVASQQTLEQLWPIYEEICEIKGSEMQYVPVVLVGNKSDEANREVPTEDGVGLAAQWKCCFMETSAKMNHNVQQLFKELFAMEKRKAVSLRVNGKKAKGLRAYLKGKCPVM